MQIVRMSPKAETKQNIFLLYPMNLKLHISIEFLLWNNGYQIMTNSLKNTVKHNLFRILYFFRIKY